MADEDGCGLCAWNVECARKPAGEFYPGNIDCLV